MRDERTGGLTVLLAGVLYGLWPPPPPMRPWWLGAWALFSIGAMLWLRLPRTRRRTARTAPASQDPRGEWPVQIAHDFRTPLMRLRLHLSGLAGEAQTADSDRIAAMEAEILQLERLADGLIDLTAGPQAWPAPDEACDAGTLAQGAADRLAPIFELQDREIRCDIAPAQQVRIDGAQLQRILDNLLSNALRYAEGQGGVTLRVAMDGPLWVRISVSNPAPAPSLALDLLRRPFVRGPAAATGAAAQGFGLGLAVVERLAENAGGRLRLSYLAPEGRFEASVAFPRQPVP